MTPDQLQTLKNALHDLETSHGLFAHDGQPEGNPETFQLDFKPAAEKLSQLIQELEANVTE